jgi:hypothetical protein
MVTTNRTMLIMLISYPPVSYPKIVSDALNMQAGTVGAAGATDPVIASMLRSLTLIGPTMYRGNSNSLLLDAWAYYFGVALDSVRNLVFVTLVSESKACFSKFTANCSRLYI